MFRFPRSLSHLVGLALLTGVVGTLTAQAAQPQPEPIGSAPAAIVFTYPKPYGVANNANIWIMNADGSNPQQLTTALGDDARPAISPDGSKIVYERIFNNTVTGWIMNRDGTKPTQINLPGNTVRLAWSPDGQKIVLSNDSVSFWELWTVTADGTGAQRLTDTPGAAGEAAWSPDGQKLVFNANPTAGYFDLYTVNSNGTGQSMLLSSSSGYSHMQAAWSPDGAKIAVIRFTSGGSAPYTLWLMDANGTNGQTLVADIDHYNYNRLAWSADGNWILFNKGDQIWRVKRDGTETVQITQTGGWLPHTNVVNFSGTVALPTVYLPYVLTTPSRGIYGQVTDQGLPAANVALELRFYNGSAWSTHATATTDSNGAYAFTQAPSLGAGQRYAVRYTNTTNPARLASWRNPYLDTYTRYQEVLQAPFDIANLALTSPIAGSARGLPLTFQWVKRPATPTDSYEFALFDPSDSNPYFFTNPALGSVNAYTLTGLPNGFSYNTWYAWNIAALSPDGGYGVSYYAYYIGFSNGVQTLETRPPADWLPTHELHAPHDSDPRPTPHNAPAAIVFTNPQPETASNANIWIVNADGTNPQQLTTVTGDDIQSVISPDGGKIAYVHRDTSSKIWVMNRDGSNPVQLNIPGNSAAPAWSPDGKKLAFENDSADWWEVWIANADGTNAQRLTTTGPAAGGPAWSPDGQKLVFSVNPSTGYQDLYTTNISGTNAAVLVSSAGTGYSYNESSWSPDGAKIAAIRWPAGSTSGPFSLWLMDANGTNGQTLVTDLDHHFYNSLAWSADGNWILFNKGGQVWRVKRDGTEAVQITTRGGWQPHTNAINFSGTLIYLPFVLTTPSRGIYGQVTDQGLPAANVALELRFYDGATWSTRATATTDSNGAYAFTQAPSLGTGQRYAVRYINPTNPARLATWNNPEIQTYSNYQEVAQAPFDIANLALISPIAGSARGLPITFLWVQRPATPSDSYEFNLFDPSDGNPTFVTTPTLGYANSYILAGLPSGFGYNTWYAWDITVHSPAGGYGVSYYAYAIGFSNALQPFGALAPKDRVQVMPHTPSTPPDW